MALQNVGYSGFGWLLLLIQLVTYQFNFASSEKEAEVICGLFYHEQGNICNCEDQRCIKAGAFQPGSVWQKQHIGGNSFFFFLPKLGMDAGGTFSVFVLNNIYFLLHFCSFSLYRGRWMHWNKFWTLSTYLLTWGGHGEREVLKEHWKRAGQT